MALDRNALEDYIRRALTWPDNTLSVEEGPAFGSEFRLGTARGDDPIFAQIRADISPQEYLLPEQWMEKRLGAPVPAAEVTVVSWALPQTEATRRAQEGQEREPARCWSANRTFGQAFQNHLLREMLPWLEAQGVEAIAPMIHPDFHMISTSRHGLASNWSERHTAFACGLGTFGLCDGLITELGKTVRLTSVVLHAQLPTVPRPYAGYRDYCLWDKGCRACIQRCPAGAIRPEGHDKQKCSAYCDQLYRDLRESYGFDGVYGCGLCQTRVPCERGIPAGVRKRDM